MNSTSLNLKNIDEKTIREKVKHLPYRCSGLIEIPRSEYLEILSRPFFKIQLRTKNGWQFLEEIFLTKKSVELALDYWRNYRR